MGPMHAFAISAAGMDLERARVEVAALNLANAHAALSPDGAGYVPWRVVARTASSAAALSGAFAGRVEHGLVEGFTAPVATVEPAPGPPRRELDPGHPLADAQGFVQYPAVDPAHEMLGVMSALRAYEANVAAMNASRTLALKALEIGGAS